MIELSILRGVAGCFWSSTINSGCMAVAVIPLLKVPHVSAFASEDTRLWAVLHYVWTGLFLLGVGFNGCGKG